MLGSQLCPEHCVCPVARRGGSSPSAGMDAVCPCCWLKCLSLIVLRANLECVCLLEGVL